ncbi:hypothetical protein ABPG72_011621 [Tetrahymena utriculariae]
MKFSDTVNRINKEFQRLQKNPVENVLAIPDPKNMFQWHFCIYGLVDCPFEGGVYHGILSLPPEYPMKPPSIKLLTPNGRFKEGTNICTSFTNYHPESWQLTWNIEKMLIAMISFMNDNDPSAGVVSTSESEKRRLAKKSIIWNIKNDEQFVRLFKPYYKQLNIDPSLFTDPQKLKEYEEQMQYQQSTTEHEKKVRNFEKVLFFGASIFLVMSSYLYMKSLK